MVCQQRKHSRKATFPSRAGSIRSESWGRTTQLSRLGRWRAMLTETSASEEMEKNKKAAPRREGLWHFI